MTYPRCSLPHAMAVIDNIDNSSRTRCSRSPVPPVSTTTPPRLAGSHSEAATPLAACVPSSAIYLSTVGMSGAVSGTFGHLGIPGNRTGWDQLVRPVSEFVGRISGADICPDLVQRTRFRVTVGVVTPTKKNVSVPFQLVQQKIVPRPSNERNPFGHVR